jgi:hypothetical protein
VVVGAGGKVELEEDRADVRLDGSLGEPEAFGDAGVGAALGHQLEHLALAVLSIGTGSRDADESRRSSSQGGCERAFSLASRIRPWMLKVSFIVVGCTSQA